MNSTFKSDRKIIEVQRMMKSKTDEVKDKVKYLKIIEGFQHEL